MDQSDGGSSFAFLSASETKGNKSKDKVRISGTE